MAVDEFLVCLLAKGDIGDASVIHCPGTDLGQQAQRSDAGGRQSLKTTLLCLLKHTKQAGSLRTKHVFLPDQ